ncbi:MAG: hypothetical protein GY816_05345 [Cytophagales bacterium]|nr:hypothetical protein [Cytophagales bacterium]
MHRNHYIPYYNNLQFIKWLIGERDRIGDKNPDLTSQNISIIINCCTVLEGFIYTVTKDFIFYEFRNSSNSTIPNKELITRIFNKYYEELDRAQWSSYTELFTLFTDVGIKSNEHWQTIGHMFSMRNQLVHGNEIEFFMNIKQNGKVSITSDNKKLRPVLEFLISKNLTTVINDGESLDFINSKVSNYFFRKLCEYCIFIYDQLSSDYHKKSTIDMFEFRN